MTDGVRSDLPVAEEAIPKEARGSGRSWFGRAVKWLLGGVGAIILGILALAFILDTDAGHRFLADRIAAHSSSAGLKVRIGRIDGSIWDEVRLVEVRAYDPKGLFLETPEIALDWRPFSWFFNRLHMNELTSDLVILHRFPELRPSPKARPILPDFDIHVGRLNIQQFRFEEGVAGKRRVAQLTGRADVRRGRALVKLDAAVKRSGERVAFNLDAEPARDHFDLDAHINAPSESVIGAMLGTRRPLNLTIKGDGRWSAWAGTARLDLSGQRAADLALRAVKGRYRLSGVVTISRFLQGKKARLTAPRVMLNATASFNDRRLEQRTSLRSAALRLESRGVIDLGASRFEDVQIAADLLRPSALFPNMSGRNIRWTALLNGGFSQFNFAYRITSPRLAFDNTGFENVRAEGRGRWSKAPVVIPVYLTASRVTGVGDVAGGILANLKVKGALKVTARELTGSRLDLISDKLKGKLALFVDLVTGRYDVILSGGLTRYLIPGLGLVDVTSELKVVPGPGGRGSIVTGHGRAWVRRFDNRFLSYLSGGLPQLETDLVRGPDRVLHFRNLRLKAPGIRISGNGYRRTDGTFHFEGSGRQQEYGSFGMLLDGRISRPRLAIRLPRPNESLGLADILLNLDPTAEGFAYRASGNSHFGPFASRGDILIPRNQPSVINVASLDVSGTTASGRLRSDPGGFTGELNLAGGGINGALRFSPAGDVQRIDVSLQAKDARLAGLLDMSLRRGALKGAILLHPSGASLEGKFSARGIGRGPLTIARLDGAAHLRGGNGRVEMKVAGTRGRDFVLDAFADVAPNQVRFTGSGTIDRRPVRLTSPALFTREGDNWRLSVTSFSFADGKATLSGLFGNRTEFSIKSEHMPLAIADVAVPGLGLGGSASGSLNYVAPAPGVEPSGSMDLKIRGLTRSGLVLSSRPVDIGVAAKLQGGHAAMRAVAVSEGRTIGRAQARVSPLGPGDDIASRLASAPLFAQLRYNGSADTLWRLTGIELLDLSGPAAVGVDIRGTLNDPEIRGSVRTDRARLESAVTGMVIDNIAARGRFGGSRLAIESFSGTTKRGGKVSAAGDFDFSAARGVAMDIALRAEAAQLIDRDDLAAQVTGPIRIRSDGVENVISGDVQLVSGSFRLGSATAAAQVPRLKVKEVNRLDEGPAPSRRVDPWRLDLSVNARRGLSVTGLGMKSEWSADLDIRGTVTEPRIYGRADLVRGSYDFAGRRFDLERGSIRFEGESPVNPVLDIVAEGGVQGLNATIHVTGRGQQPQIAFTSTPALPEDELLSRLLFGTSITNLSAPEALQLAAAIASLNESGPGLDPINVVRTATGLDRLRILPADVTTGQGTSIAAGKYLGRGVYVEVITDARGYSATQIEYQITKWLSLLSSISTIGRESVNVKISKDY